MNEQYSRNKNQPEAAFSIETPVPRTNLVFQPTPKTNAKPTDINNKFNTLTQPDEINNNFSTFVQPYEPKHGPSVVSDLTKFLIKKDLLLSRIQNFDDPPENYSPWKVSFKSITEELSVTTFEEIDLLVKWLGPESSRFSQNSRSSNVNNPSVGLLRIWERLDERFGRPEMIESSIKSKLQKFCKIGNKNTCRYYELLDILIQIESSKENPEYSSLLAYFDSSSCIIPIIEKLPYNIQEKWTSRASNYKTKHRVPFPPFSFFVMFIKEICVIKNDPAFNYHNTDNTVSKRIHDTRRNVQTSTTVFNRRTDIYIREKEGNDNSELCPIHKAKHSLATCRAFKVKSYDERKQILKDNRICYKCCQSSKHVSRNCTAEMKCNQWNSNTHMTIMHRPENVHIPYGGEKSSKLQDSTEYVSSKCTSLCDFSGKSCGKTILVHVYPKAFPDKVIKVYAILDDQSKKTLAKPELFDQLQIDITNLQYTMSTCAGQTAMTGRCASHLVVEPLFGGSGLNLSSVIEFDNIPNERSEIPTPDVAASFPHLRSIAGRIPELNTEARIQLLIGRDIPEAHHVHKQIVGPKGTPFAQELSLCWVIVGDICLCKMHKPNTVNANRTHVVTVEERYLNLVKTDCLFEIMRQLNQTMYKRHGFRKTKYSILLRMMKR